MDHFDGNASPGYHELRGSLRPPLAEYLLHDCGLDMSIDGTAAQEGRIDGIIVGVGGDRYRRGGLLRGVLLW